MVTAKVVKKEEEKKREESSLGVAKPTADTEPINIDKLTPAQKEQRQREHQATPSKFSTGPQSAFIGEGGRSAGITTRAGNVVLGKTEDIKPEQLKGQLDAQQLQNQKLAEDLKLQQDIQRKEDFQTLVSGDLSGQINQEITEGVDLSPNLQIPDFGQVANAAQASPFSLTDSILNQIGVPRETMTSINKAKTVGQLSAAITALGAVAIPTAASIASISLGKLTNGVVLGLGAVGGAGFFGSDIGRGKLDTSKGKIEAMSEVPSTIVGAVGVRSISAEEGIRRIRQMHQTLLDAEADMKRDANFNIQYRFSKEYEEQEEENLKLRNEMIEAIGEIDNLAATGATSPPTVESILFDAQKFEDLNKRIK